VSNELAKQGMSISAFGARGVWLRHEPIPGEKFRARLPSCGHALTFSAACSRIAVARSC